MSASKNIHSDKRGSNLEPLLNSEHTVTIEKLVVGGDGLARINYENKSLVVFIPFSAPADVLKIRIVSAEKNHLEGKILEIITPSSSRKKPPCPYFENCGGCTWQHIDETVQRQQKELILTDLFKKFLPDIGYDLKPTVFAENQFRYRNRIQLKQKSQQLGYFKRSAHEIVDIEDCLIAENAIAEQILLLKKNLKHSAELKKYELHINSENKFEYYPIGDSGEGLSFSQVNNYVNQLLVEKTVELVVNSNPNFLTELYAGAGNFTFPLLQKLPLLKIESAELNSKLTAFSTKKITQFKLQKRLTAFTTDCESFVSRRPISEQFLLLDPPRSGCSEQVLNEIVAAKSKNILYISCHPAFLVRDLQRLLRADPKYKIAYLQIFDMFPQTDHFETLVLLTK